MKIFLSFLQGKPDHPIAGYKFWEYYIKNGIKEAGYEICECPEVDWAYGLVMQSDESRNAWRSNAWETTLHFLRQHPVDLFLSYFYPQHIDESAIREIQKMGIPCVNFFCDNIRNFRKIPEVYGVFDLNWVPEYNAIPLYKRAGFRCINLPMPMWVAPEQRLLKEEALPQVTFIGSRDIQRLLLFEAVALRSSDIPLALYGAGWKTAELPAEATFPGRHYGLKEKLDFQFEFIRKEGISAYFRKIRQRNFHPSSSERMGRYLRGKPDFKEYIRLSQESLITVGVNRYESFRFPLHKPDTYSRLRDLEAPMLGACFLTEYTAGLDQMYEIGKEIMVYNNADEFIEQSNRMLGDKPLRDSLRINGQARALKDHSIPTSINMIISHLRIKK